MRRQRGLAASVEAVVVIPALVLFILLLLAIARIAGVDQAVSAAAASGARSLTLSRDTPASLESTVDDILQRRNVTCARKNISVISDSHQVTVTIRCAVALADIALPLLPGEIWVETQRTSPKDPYR